MARILVTSRSFGKYDNNALSHLRAFGHEVILMGADFNQEKFESEVLDCDAVILGNNPFPEKILGKCKKLKAICKHGVGVDNIPLEKARECGVHVFAALGVNSNAVADLTFGLILASSRNIIASNKQVHERQWKPIVGHDVCYKTLGLLGFGSIARCVARRAKGFEMEVLAFVRDPETRPMNDEFKSYVRYCDLDTVLTKSDIISVHLAANSETIGLINESTISRMKNGAYFINTARGAIVDEKALAEALRSGHLAGAALDVTAVEPIESDNELLSLDNVIITPHMGMSSEETISAVGMVCARCITSYLDMGQLEVSYCIV